MKVINRKKRTPNLKGYDRFLTERILNYKMPYGQHRGKTLRNIYLFFGPKYLEWCAKNLSDKETKNNCDKALGIMKKGGSIDVFTPYTKINA